MCRSCRRLLPPTPFRRGGFTSWGFRKGWKTTRYSIAESARRTAAAGYEWIAVHLDWAPSGNPQVDLDSQATAAFNRQSWPNIYEQFRNQGVLVGAWFTQGGNVWDTPPNADLSIAEIEGPGDYDGVINVIRGVGAGPLPACPLGTVTNFSTLTRDRAKPLIDAGFTCLPEAYMNETASKTPDAMDRTARSLGWPTSQPVAGVYPVGGNPVPSYAPWAGWPLADYLLEYVI